MHSLPQAGGAADADSRRTRIGRLKMFIVFAVCATPVVASYFTYYVIRPEGRRNYGDLIEPQRTMPVLTARTLEGREVPLSVLRDQWLLLSVAGGACDAACEKHLYLQRQLREAMGREKDRVDWVWLIDDDAPVRPELLPALRAATVLRVNRDELARWLAPAAQHRMAEHLYVVDPLGNWMMRFPASLDAGRAKRDLERLLRASSWWDVAGRPTDAKPAVQSPGPTPAPAPATGTSR